MKKTLFMVLAIFCLLGLFIGCTEPEEDVDTTIDVEKDVTTGVVTVIINEEDNPGFVSTTGTLKTHASYPGYTNKYIESLGAGSNVVFCVNSSMAADVALSFKYAFWGGTTEIRAAYVYINGVLANESSPIYCPWTSKSGTDGNDIWQMTAEVNVPLVAGNNNIRIVPVPAGVSLPDATFPASVSDADKPAALAAGSSGKLPNFDYLQLKTLAANAPGHTLTAASGATVDYYSLSVTEGTNGSVSSSTTLTTVESGTSVTVTATPASGYVFESWTGTNPSTSNPYTLSVTEDTTLVARFLPTGTVQQEGLVGFGAVQSDSAVPYILTGGLGGDTVTVTTLAELEAALTATEPRIIKVETLITTADDVSKTITAQSNKTIISESGNGHIKNIEVKLNGENYIVKNMTFSEVIALDTVGGAGNDALKIGGGSHVWIDHCEFYSNLSPKHNDGTANADVTSSDDIKDYYDGLLDITNGAAFITISNCYFHDHYKAILCGSGDGASDALHDQKIRITMHHNYFYKIGSRTPLLRYGKAHIYNNYWDGSSMIETSAINARAGAEVLVENNYFTGIEKALGFYFDVSGVATGKWNVSGNVYGSADSSYAPSSSTTNWEPSYAWTLDATPTSAPTNVGVVK